MDDLSNRISRLEKMLLELKTSSEINSSISIYTSSQYVFTIYPTSRYLRVVYKDVEQAVFSTLTIEIDGWWVGVVPQLPVDNTQNFLLSIPEGLTEPVQANVVVASTLPVTNITLV